MEFWITFWGWLLVVVLVVYAILAIVIAIGGFFDIKEMLASLDERQQERTKDEDE